MKVSEAARGPDGGKLSNIEFEDEKMRASLRSAGNDSDFAKRRPSASMLTPKFDRRLRTRPLYRKEVWCGLMLRCGLVSWSTVASTARLQ